MATPASRAQRAMLWSTARKVSKGRPSSMINPQLSQRGTAPPTARSLTVPHTASVPMSPPANESGETT